MPGVYEIADEDKQTIYIGQSSRDVPNRIRQHLERSTCVSARAAFWRYAHSRIPQSHEADHLRRFRSTHGELPPCNRALPRERDTARRARERMRSDDT